MLSGYYYFFSLIQYKPKLLRLILLASYYHSFYFLVLN